MTTDLVPLPGADLAHTSLADDVAAIKAAVRAVQSARNAAENAAERAVSVADSSAFEIGRRLLAIHTHEKWREAGYRGFKPWVEAECGHIYGFGGKSRAYQLMDAAKVAESVHQPDLVDTPTIPVKNERQARALNSVEPERRSEVLQKAAAAGKVTAASITAAAETIDEPEPVDAEVVDEWVTCPHCGGTGQVRA